MILSGNAFSASKETSVLRQKRPPAVSLELINKATKDRLDTNASAEESSSATSEENSLDAGLKAMYAQDEYFRDSLTSWKSPTSPAGTFPIPNPFYFCRYCEWFWYNPLSSPRTMLDSDTYIMFVGSLPYQKKEGVAKGNNQLSNRHHKSEVYPWAMFKCKLSISLVQRRSSPLQKNCFPSSSNDQPEMVFFSLLLVFSFQ